MYDLVQSSEIYSLSLYAPRAANSKDKPSKLWDTGENQVLYAYYHLQLTPASVKANIMLKFPLDSVSTATVPQP